MKDSIFYPQERAIKHELCNEKRCATCFQNRGCMYEQYLLALMQNMETAHLNNQLNKESTAIIKRA